MSLDMDVDKKLHDKRDSSPETDIDVTVSKSGKQVDDGSGSPHLAVNELDRLPEEQQDKTLQEPEEVEQPQDGVAQMEAITASWSKTSLIVVYIW